ncbi:MAG: aminopeptidase N [Pseudomonadota bacterium]
MTEQKPTCLADYAPPAFLVDRVALTFRLAPTGAEVDAVLQIRPNPAAAAGQDLWLDGRALELVSASLDGQRLSGDLCAQTEDGLRVPARHLPVGPFTWTCTTRIDPAENTALEGLYMSKGMYCTQCEAEGFRKITYFPDRPDVMAVYTVRIQGDVPVMLSNGNPVDRGEGYAVWHDPWPKPSYLFALVAGDLRSTTDRFVTASGREVALAIWVRDGDEARCAYALDALKRSMRWDEAAYGREYDLDVFNIVAVDDFNMGAMENKGLNIFNSKFVLADVDTATDTDFANIETIIAHEYFHNWTGNRVTCRDWFQLSLKEGLTVFRDQQFSADMRSAAVERIGNVRALRAAQFPEDAGPLAHPVRPSAYVEINNFYTATVYEKGAELIRMLRSLVGPAAYRDALDLYFARHDGQACTIEDWLAAFEDSAGIDLSQFKLWYAQAGTPRLTVSEDWDGANYRLAFRQSTPQTQGQTEKQSLVIPIAYALLATDGRTLVEPRIYALTSEHAELEFALPERPVASILRGFSAPVILERTQSEADRRLLMRHDSDPFCRWEAGQGLARSAIFARCAGADSAGAAWLDAAADMALDERLDPAYRALALGLPDEDGLAAELALLGQVPDPQIIYESRRSIHSDLAGLLRPKLADMLKRLETDRPYRPDAAQTGQRALSGVLLWLSALAEPEAETCRSTYQAANNMTERLAALSALVACGKGDAELRDFAMRWTHDRLVMDKWFSLQAGRLPPNRALAVARQLAKHQSFDWKNPNRFRALVGAFARNIAAFHAKDGGGYAFVAEWVARLDPVNPQTAARLLGAFESWQRYDATRQSLIRSALKQIAARRDLSRNSREIVERMLNA